MLRGCAREVRDVRHNPTMAKGKLIMTENELKDKDILEQLQRFAKERGDHIG